MAAGCVGEAGGELVVDATPADQRPDARSDVAADARTDMAADATVPEIDAAPPAFVVHPRTDWQTAGQPITGPSRDLGDLRYVTIHYNGGNTDLDGADNVYQDEDFAQILRNNQNDYVTNRGYSLGYNSAIAPDGDEWEIRGTEFRSAANGCTAVNTPGHAILVILPSVEAIPTQTQIDGVKQAVARIRGLAASAGNNNALYLNGHRDVRPTCGNGGTACPGDALYALIQNGGLEP